MRAVTCDVPAARGQVRHSLFVSWRVTPRKVCASFSALLRGFCTFFVFISGAKSAEIEIFYIENESRRFFSSEQLDPSAGDDWGDLLIRVSFF